MLPTKAYAAQTAKAPLTPWNFERRDVSANDVLIEILYCGVCHSDIHQARDEWGGAIFPMVPGHEIVGRVTEVGSAVTKFKTGDLAGIGCMVNSCRECPNCERGREQFCNHKRTVFTYNSVELDGTTPTYGGYSNQIVCDQDFVLRISEKLDLKAVAPLLCAGITTYSPLRKWGVGKGHKVGVVGLGGLGHMAVKFAAAFGAEVTMLSTSQSKEADARRLGAHRFCNTRDAAQLQSLANYFDFIIDTVSAPHDYNLYLGLLATDGVQICVGVPPSAMEIVGFNLIANSRAIAGSLIGGIPETQEMLDFCAEHGIVSDVEMIAISEVNEAYERVLKSDVKYRFVIDMATLK